MSRRAMKLCVFAALALLLVGCGTIDGGISLPVHSHVAPQSDNVVGHDPVGYCGNTITQVRCEKPGNWEHSFWGGNSVRLTDFLRWLDYKDEICRCLPEYYVQTELSEAEYGISLTEGYVRHEGKQCQLTEDQLIWLTETLAEIKAGAGEDVCALPPAEQPVFGE